MRSHSIGALALSLLLTACGPGDPVAAVPINGSGGSGGGSSTGGSTGGSVGGVAILSHNAGQDCLSCHKTGGTGAGKGVFTVAGTVYKSGGGAQTAATVTIFPQGSNTAQATMTVDGLGNFWTTQAVAALMPAAGQTLVQGVRAVIQPTGGTSAAMLGVISNGSCNGCHSTAGGVARVTAQMVDAGTVRAASASTGEGAASAAALPTNPSLAQIAVGANHACVVKSDGAVLCWGSNAGDSPTPAPVAALGHVLASTADQSIAAGDNQTCVIESGGNLVLCFGGSAPVSMLSLAGVTALAAAGNDTCARTGAAESALFYCWNADTTAHLVAADGNAPAALLPLINAGTLAGRFTAPDVAGLAGTTFTQVSAAANHSCGITTDDHVKCWEGTHASVDVPIL
jgi:alpha-tubulin suppressor-like RCC1 family protein